MHRGDGELPRWANESGDVMKVALVGLGRVGTVTEACVACTGHDACLNGLHAWARFA